MIDRHRSQFWKYARALAPPVLVLALLVGGLGQALYSRVQIWQNTDEENLREWLEESRIFRKTLPELAQEYLARANPIKAAEIRAQLDALGGPLKTYQGQLPMFPVVYRLELVFPHAPSLAPIVWDARLPRPRSGERQQVRELAYALLGDDDPRAVLRLEYQLHAYNARQREEAEWRAFIGWLSALALATVFLAGAWIYVFLRRERQREVQRLLAQRQIEYAEKQLLENQLRRREAELKHDELERTLLEQRVATQEAEQKALEIKSQIYASIGIMAGSYAHNIKNLLVRPNDLLRRCLEAKGMPAEQEHLLHEVQQTLHTVTERLQQILKTVRRDPTRSELTRLNLNELVTEIRQSWEGLALPKWKLRLRAETWPEPLWIAADRSHLMQAVENLLFNARDATFEMRSQRRDQARRDPQLGDQERRQSLIAAAAWEGEVVLRTSVHGREAILEVADNGIGMTEEVRRRCAEPHFSTKRDNAAHEGNTTGMGLGLSFVQTILEHHRGRMEIISAPEQGATIRLYFAVVP